MQCICNLNNNNNNNNHNKNNTSNNNHDNHNKSNKNNNIINTTNKTKIFLIITKIIIPKNSVKIYFKIITLIIIIIDNKTIRETLSVS